MNIDGDIDEVFGGAAAANVVAGQKRSCKIVDSVCSASVASSQDVLDGLESPVQAQNRSLRLPVANPIAPS